MSREGKVDTLVDRSSFEDKPEAQELVKSRDEPMCRFPDFCLDFLVMDRS